MSVEIVWLENEEGNRVRAERDSEGHENALSNGYLEISDPVDDEESEEDTLTKESDSIT
jgi:hypothetical protein